MELGLDHPVAPSQTLASVKLTMAVVRKTVGQMFRGSLLRFGLLALHLLQNSVSFSFYMTWRTVVSFFW